MQPFVLFVVITRCIPQKTKMKTSHSFVHHGNKEDIIPNDRMIMQDT